MTIKRIQYTVRPEFVETNKGNINKVMDELRSLKHPGIRYSSYILDDGKTFMHYVVMRDEEASKTLNDLAVFKEFQAAIKASNPEVPPKAENMTLVGSSYELLA